MLHTKAREFSLLSSTGHQVTLSDLLGSFVLLIFYPANDTPTCSTQLSDMSVNLDKLMELNTRVFGVNTASADKSKDFCVRRRLEFPILSDPGGRVAKTYGAAMGWLPWIKRTVVLICPRGEIIFYEQGVPHPDRVIETITVCKSLELLGPEGHETTSQIPSGSNLAFS